MQAQACRGLAVVFGQGDLILIVGGLLGVLLVVVIDTAVDVHRFDPRQDRLEPVDDETVLAVLLILILALARFAIGMRGIGGRCGGVGLLAAGCSARTGSAKA